jgi:hypothetical protein
VKEKTTPSQKELSRRRFIGSSAAALAGVGLSSRKKLFAKDRPAGEEEVKIKEYRTLGRTGFKVSDMSFGSGELAEPALLEAILDAEVMEGAVLKG